MLLDLMQEIVTELSWHLLVSLRLLDPNIFMLYLFYVNHLIAKDEVLHKKSV